MRGVVGQQRLDQLLDRVEVAQVARRDVRGAARGLDLGLDLVELLLRARDEDRDAAGGRDLQRRGAADAARRAGDDDRLAVDRALEGAVLVEVGVERALPVVPQLLGVAGQRRQRRCPSRGARAGCRARRSGSVSAMYSTTSSGMPRSASTCARICLSAGSFIAKLSTPLGRFCVARLSIRMTALGACPASANVLSTSPTRWPLGSTTWKAWPSRSGWWAMWSIDRGDVVDRDDVGPAPLERDQREPLRQRVPDLLDQLEEVVRAVDLVHLAGARVADDDRRAVDAPRGLDPLADELLGLELRAVVRVGQLLALVEHVLVERALVVEAGDRDRGHVVERADLERVGEVDRVLGAADVEQRVARLVRAHVVDRGEVEEVVDLALELVGVDAEPRLAEVADDRLDPVGLAPAARSARRASRASPRARARGCRPRARAAARRGDGR